MLTVCASRRVDSGSLAQSHPPAPPTQPDDETPPGQPGPDKPVKLPGKEPAQPERKRHVIEQKANHVAAAARVGTQTVSR